MIGVLTNETGNRSKNVSYQNTTGEDLFVLINGIGGNAKTFVLSIGEATSSYEFVANHVTSASGTQGGQIVGIVPPDYFYKISGTADILYWWEYETQEVSASSTTDIMYTGATMQEWLFVSSVVIFFLSFMAWRHIFGFLKRFRDKDE